jgi:hypothetical protein
MPTNKEDSSKGYLGCILHSGIGNRLFQYASTYGIAKYNRRDHTVVHAFSDKIHQIDATSVEYETLFRYDSHTTPTSELNQSPVVIPSIQKNGWFILTEPSDLFHTKVFCEFSQNVPSRTCVYGYLQCEEYFNHCQDDIRSIFQEPITIQSYLDAKYKKDAFEHMYFIHVRLGDYVRDPANRSLHFIDFTKYYQDAIRAIVSDQPNASFTVFTEDVEGLMQVYPFLSKFNVIYEPNDIAGLYMLARCKKGGICANSSYSWWGAWLNPNPLKRVILPSRWFNSRPADQRLTMKGAEYVDP